MKPKQAIEPEWMRKERLLMAKATLTKSIQSKTKYNRKKSKKEAADAAFHIYRIIKFTRFPSSDSK